MVRSFCFWWPGCRYGLTGRKIFVDPLWWLRTPWRGVFSREGSFKGDRSAAYMAGYFAKNFVPANLADNCEVQFSYSIGVAKPTRFM
ncbi:MAG: hypothetical protein Ct9H300mP29_5430 [Candidatus Neomarinimicrobiota bacterium]|nr:MAG: hypothetical protein Ct9H300mP29_5430 [Candidatus Neomarinimicrobiota bacterium]